MTSINQQKGGRGEAHRALELLEDYHSRLSTPQDRALRSAIERVIRIFKSRLFQALLDIQEFYELTLLDESKTVQQKTAETLLIASKWEQDNAIKANEAHFMTNLRCPSRTAQQGQKTKPAGRAVRVAEIFGVKYEHISAPLERNAQRSIVS
uniref:L27 domain-containing protein n=1 Tax=Anopheles coluzzii TaxID=1518534 RepID=A0A8W7P3G2_ANOCL